MSSRNVADAVRKTWTVAATLLIDQALAHLTETISSPFSPS